MYARHLFWAGALLLVLMYLARPVVAMTLDDEMRKAAVTLKERLEQKKQATVALGAITGPSTSPSSGGPAVAEALGRHLGALGIGVKARADFGIAGKYRPVKDDKQGVVVEIELKLVDQEENPVDDPVVRRVLKDEDVIALLGPSGTRLPPSKPGDRGGTLLDDVRNPSVFIDGAVVRAREDSEYGIEIVVGEAARSAEAKDGYAFVDIRQDETYAVRITNDADHETAVTLAIDGLSMFVFSEVRDPATKLLSYQCLILAPKSSALIKGWHVTNEASDSFKVTEYAKSAAAELKVSDPGKVGTITASFARAYEKGQRPADDRPQTFKYGDRGTGRGPRVEMKYEEVEREIGKVRESVSVRYTRPDR